MAKRTNRKTPARAKDPLFERPGVRAAAFVLVGLVAAGLLGGAGYGVWAVDAKARQSLAAVPQEVEISWPQIARGSESKHVLDEQVRAEIRSQVEAIINHEADPFSAQSLEQAGTWLASSGWFDRVPTVERVDTQRVRVTGVWRRPVAMVRYGRGDLARDYLVDSELRLLPKVYARGERSGPFLTGATHAPAGNAPWTPDLSTPWPDQSLVEGLELLMLLVRQPFASQVAGVDVRDYFVENRLEIITDRGSRVVWGGPVGEYIPGEADTQQKLNRLMQLFNDPAYGRRIDAGLDRLEVFDQQVLIDRTGG